MLCLHRLHRQPATSTVTFALIAPLFFLILFGIMEGGRVLHAWLVISNEALEGARYGAVRYDSTKSADVQAAAVHDYVTARLQGVLSQNPVDVAGVSTPNPQVTVSVGAPVDPVSGAPTGPARVLVTIVYRVPLVIPIVSDVLPNPFPLAARSSMRAE